MVVVHNKVEIKSSYSVSIEVLSGSNHSMCMYFAQKNGFF